MAENKLKYNDGDYKMESKGLTYEEIARMYDITSSKAQSIVKSAYNKMIKSMVEKQGLNIFDTVLALREYFNMTESEAIEKLNDEHRDMLTKYASEQYNIKSDIDKESSDFTSLFK